MDGPDIVCVVPRLEFGVVRVVRTYVRSRGGAGAYLLGRGVSTERGQAGYLDIWISE